MLKGSLFDKYDSIPSDILNGTFEVKRTFVSGVISYSSTVICKNKLIAQ